MELTREMVAKDINGSISGLGRQLNLNWEMGYEDNQIITLENEESWSDGGMFTVCNDFPVSYQLFIENEVPCHIVDYTNEDELKAIGAEECEDERECLIPAGTKLRVLQGEQAIDLQEMGYYTIHLEYIEEACK
ncbi:hypothetical protein [Listeria booriae]|uniref:hypothetical protein n=1 Tax=Listeria booriae TaxID=1552123 RepID=UPI00164DEEB3|nr:hypothetical protein [Listeria booriae]MBC6301524.1 hypothetical protein [Listeria booriae]